MDVIHGMDKGDDPLGCQWLWPWKSQCLHTKQGLCRVTYARGWMRMCVEFRDEILLRGGGGM